MYKWIQKKNLLIIINFIFTGSLLYFRKLTVKTVANLVAFQNRQNCKCCIWNSNFESPRRNSKILFWIISIWKYLHFSKTGKISIILLFAIDKFPFYCFISGSIFFLIFPPNAIRRNRNGVVSNVSQFDSIIRTFVEQGTKFHRIQFIQENFGLILLKKNFKFHKWIHFSRI